MQLTQQNKVINLNVFQYEQTNNFAEVSFGKKKSPYGTLRQILHLFETAKN